MVEFAFTILGLIFLIAGIIIVKSSKKAGKATDEVWSFKGKNGKKAGENYQKRQFKFLGWCLIVVGIYCIFRSIF